MAYSTNAQVQSLFRSLSVTTTSTVTTTELTEIITEVDAEIDSKLSDHYTVPITGVSSLLIIGKISRMKSAHMVKTILEATAQHSDREQEVQSNLEMKANQMLNDIIPTYDKSNDKWIDPIMTLTDAVRKNKSPRSGSIMKSNTRTATIIRGGNNW